MGENVRERRASMSNVEFLFLHNIAASPPAFFTYQVSTFPTVIYNQVPLFCNAITRPFDLFICLGGVFITSSVPTARIFSSPFFLYKGLDHQLAIVEYI
jgi:hypothetical protein